VTWLLLGPIPIGDKNIAHYMSQNNTIFQVTDQEALKFVSEILERSLQFRIEKKVDAKLNKSQKPKISYEFEEDKIAKEIEKYSSGKETEIDITEEFKHFKP
jgi:hypothetical protein